jgi:hypothetical protein
MAGVTRSRTRASTVVKLAMAAGALAFIAAACTTGGGGGGNPPPLAISSPSISSGPAPLSVDFDASASSDPNGTIVAWNWDFGDFTAGSGEMVTHLFPAGTYTVTLTVETTAAQPASRPRSSPCPAFPLPQPDSLMWVQAVVTPMATSLGTPSLASMTTRSRSKGTSVAAASRPTATRSPERQRRVECRPSAFASDPTTTPTSGPESAPAGARGHPI